MNWKLTLHFEDGTSEPLYCVTREEARDRARHFRAVSLGQDTFIGKPVSRTSITKL